MNAELLLQELIDLLRLQGVKVRRELIEESRGGLCTVAGAQVLFLDTRTEPLQAARICAQALCRIVDIQSIYVRPHIREFIEGAISGGQH